MRVFLIRNGHYRGKNIQVTKYIKLDNGVKIAISHNLTSRDGTELQWVQTVSENGSFFKDCRLRPYVDPFGKSGSLATTALVGVPGVCKADDALPFYWTADDLKNGSGPGFSDTPREPAPAKGRTWINFLTALAEVTDKTVHHLVAITWGFDRFADGTVKENGIHIATMAQMRDHGMALKKMYPSFKFT